MAQTRWVAQALRAISPGLIVEEVAVVTDGDRFLDRHLATIGGKGLFVNELEKLIVQGEADLAVHSVKDLPGELHDDLDIFALPEREDAGDLLLAREAMDLDDLQAGSVVGTASLRRNLLVRLLRPDLSIKLLRGNVETRIRKLQESQYDAIILAAAGLNRLNIRDVSATSLDKQLFVPAPGQGAIAVQGRRDDKALQTLVAKLDHLPTRVCVQAERKVSQVLGGSCTLPLGVYAQLKDGRMHIHSVIGSTEDLQFIRMSEDFPDPSRLRDAAEQSEKLGSIVATKLTDAGAARFLCSPHSLGNSSADQLPS